MKALALALCLLLAAPTQTAQTGTTVMLGIQGVDPTVLHLATAQMVDGCLRVWAPGYRSDPEYRLIGWAIADQLVIVDSGVPAYGITVLDPETHTALIVIERPYWLHPSVISHELIHYLLGEIRDDPRAAIWRCEMRFPGGLPERLAVSRDSVAVLIRVAGG